MDLNKIQSMIERRHPEYQEKLEHWNFLEATYKGGRAWFGSNIFKYMKEGDSEFNDRIRRAYRFNHSREIVDLINKYVFRGEIYRQEEGAPECIKQFWKRSTRREAGIASYMRYLSKLSSIFGRIWVVVDSVNLGIGESVRDSKVRSYSYEITPQNALDMSFDEEGNLNWILLRETVRDDEDPFDCTGDVSAQYRLWTRNEWFLFCEDAKPNGGKLGEKVTFSLNQQGEHNLGVVPVFPLDHMISESIYTSPSLIDDIAYLDRAVANYLSNLDAIIQDQTFSQLAMPAQGLLPGKDGYDALIEAGTKRIFTYDGEGGNAPFYLSPDPKQAQMLITAIKQIINEIYHSVGCAGERTKQDNSMGIDNSSGVAKAYDFDRVNSLLVAKAASLQHAELQMMKLVMLWSGEATPETLQDEDLESFISYPDNFDARGLYDELDISNRIQLLTAPIELRRYQLKRLVDKLYPFISDKDRKELESAISKMDDATEMLTNQVKTAALPKDSIRNDAQADKSKKNGQDSDQRNQSAKKEAK